jgi:hypothetical protein
MALDTVQASLPTSSNRQDPFSRFEWMHENQTKLPLVRRVPTLQYSEGPSPEKEKSTGKVRERVPAAVSSSIASSSDEDIYFEFGGSGIPHQYQVVSASQVDQSDSTIHFSLDVADDIEGHLEEVSRLKRWGHFHEAIEYFTANLKHHLDLPLVFLGYADLLVEQGSYGHFYTPVSSQRWDHQLKSKCLPISSDENGPDLYKQHFNLLGLRNILSFTSFSANDMDEMDHLQPDSFCEYLDKRASSRRGTHSAHGDEIPFDSTEVLLSYIRYKGFDFERLKLIIRFQVQIIRNHLEIRSEIRCKGKTPIPDFDTRCWPELYSDLLMGARVWELCDLLLAMFHYFGIAGTWERLFHADEENKGKKPQTIHCLERLLKDWTIDEYDEATELAILTIVVEMMYMLDIGSQGLYLLPKDRNLSLTRCAQQAEQCAADIKEYSPHLTKSRPYLQWILAKEHFDRQQNRSTSYREQRERHFEAVSGLVLNKWCLPVYIPVATENPGWPSPDPKFPPSEQLQWALKTSKELLDYKTQAMLLTELICRVEDPRPLFMELDQLQGEDQGDLVQLYESFTSQYLLAIDDASRQELLQTLQAQNSQFESAPTDDVCVATRWNGLMVQNALARSVSDNAELIEQNVKLEQSMREGLPYTQKAIDKLARAVVKEKQRAKERAGQSKKSGFAANDCQGEQEPEASKRLEHIRHLDSFKEDVFHRLGKLELEMLQHKQKALEEELRRTKMQRELEQFGFKQRLKAEEERFRKQLRERVSGNAPSLKTIENKNNEPTWKQQFNNGDKAQVIHTVKPPTDETILTNDVPGKIDDDAYAHHFKEPQTPHKPYRYASIEEIQDEPTTFEKRGQSPANPGTTEPQAIFEEPGELGHEDGFVGESGRPSEEIGATVYVEEEASLGDGRRSRPHSSTRSSRRDSPESIHRQPRMIQFLDSHD